MSHDDEGIDLLKAMGVNRSRRRAFRLGESEPKRRRPATKRALRRAERRAREAARKGDYRWA